MICSSRRLHCLFKKYSIHKGYITQYFQKNLLTFGNVLDNVSTSHNLCALSFNVFFRFTEMCGNLLLFPLCLQLEFDESMLTLTNAEFFFPLVKLDILPTKTLAK